MNALETMSESDRDRFAKLYASAVAINSDFKLDFDSFIDRDNTGGNDSAGGDDGAGDDGDATNNEVGPGVNTSQDSTSGVGEGKITAPNTGTLERPQNSSAKVGFALGAIATVSGLIGMVVIAKSYLFSPLKVSRLKRRK